MRGAVATMPDDDRLPLADADWWTTADVAAYRGVQVGTISAYRQRGQMPGPDGWIGGRPAWRPDTITTWKPGRARGPEGQIVHFGG